jgi:hypothetical protein
VADDFQVNIPTSAGETFAGDDIGGVKWQRIKLTLGDDGVNDGDVSSANPVPTQQARPSAATRSSVAGAAADTLILAANTARIAATVHNDSTALLYLGLGTTAASTSNFTVKMQPDAYYEVPQQFTGQIRGIWASATGNARVTELT